VTPEGTTSGFVSPDGKEVVVNEAGGSLRIFPLDGGKSRSVPGTIADEGVVRWSTDGKTLLVANYSSVPTVVEKLDPATGRREPYATLGPSDMTGAIQISSIALRDDGRSRAYGVRRLASHLFLMSGAK
jgi:Tol biopolymer transport system component